MTVMMHAMPKPPPPTAPYVVPGPTTPPIFIGHIKNSDRTGARGDHGKASQELVYELVLKDPVVIEGIHIVPNNISPPGMNFIGRTKPEMSERPFNLNIYGRVTHRSTFDAASVPPADGLTCLLSLTISGGVQWLALASSYEVDYLAVKGDYEELSIMIHGTRTESAEKDTTLPYPDCYDELYSMQERLPVVASHPLQSMQNYFAHSVTNSSLQGILHLQLTTSAKCKNSLAEGSILSADSFISLPKAAELVEIVFSFSPISDSQLGQKEVEDAAEFANKVKDLLQGCWQSGRSLSAGQDYSRVSECIGEETASILCSHVHTLLKGFAESKRGLVQDYDQVDLLLDLATALLQCCSQLLMNELTAWELLQTGSLAMLFTWLYATPKLPPEPLRALIYALLHACSHYNLFVQSIYSLLTVDQTQLSPYQLLLYSLSAVCDADRLYTPSFLLLQVCSYNHTLYSMQTYWSNICGQLQGIARKVIDRASSVDQVNIQHAQLQDDESEQMYGDNRSSQSIAARNQEDKEICVQLVQMLKQFHTYFKDLHNVWQSMHTHVQSIAQKQQRLDDEEDDIYSTYVKHLDDILVNILHHAKYMTIMQNVYNALSLCDEVVSASSAHEDIDELRQAGYGLRYAVMEFMQRLIDVDKIDLLVNLSVDKEDSLTAFLAQQLKQDIGTYTHISLYQAVRTPLGSLEEREQHLWASMQLSQHIDRLVAYYSQLSKKVLSSLSEGTIVYSEHYQMIQSGLLYLLHSTVGRDMLVSILAKVHLSDLLAMLQQLIQLLYNGGSEHAQARCLWEVLYVHLHLLYCVLSESNEQQQELLQVLLHTLQPAAQALNCPTDMEVHRYVCHVYKQLCSYQQCVRKCRSGISVRVTTCFLSAEEFDEDMFRMKLLLLKQLQPAASSSLTTATCLEDLLDNVQLGLQLYFQVFAYLVSGCCSSQHVDDMLQSRLLPILSSIQTQKLGSIETSQMLNRLLSFLDQNLTWIDMVLKNATKPLHLHYLKESCHLICDAFIQSYAFEQMYCKQEQGSGHVDQLQQLQRSASYLLSAFTHQQPSGAVVTIVISYVLSKYAKHIEEQDGCIALLAEYLSYCLQDTAKKDESLLSAILLADSSAEDQQWPDIAKQMLLTLWSTSTASTTVVKLLALLLTASTLCPDDHVAIDICTGIIATLAQLLRQESSTGVEELLVRYLHSLHLLAQQTALGCYLLCKEGLLQHLHTLLDRCLSQSSTQMSLISSLCQLYLCLQQQQLSSLIPSIEEGQGQKHMRHIAVRMLLDKLSLHLCTNIPKILKKYFHNNLFVCSCLHLLHISYSPSSYRSLLQEIQAIGEGFTLEFIVINVWTLLEDSFQSMIEAWEVQKTVTSLGNASTVQVDAKAILALLLHTHHSFCTALYTLQVVLDLSLFAYLTQQMNLQSLHKCMRNNVVEPKKLLIRYQRAYVMYMTSLVDMQIDNKQDKVSFDARHSLCTAEFKGLLELVNRYSSFSSKPLDELTPDWSGQQELEQVSFLQPFELISQDEEQSWLHSLATNSMYRLQSSQQQGEQIITQDLLTLHLESIPMSSVVNCKLLTLGPQEDKKERKRRISDMLVDFLPNKEPKLAVVSLDARTQETVRSRPSRFQRADQQPASAISSGAAPSMPAVHTMPAAAFPPAPAMSAPSMPASMPPMPNSMPNLQPPMMPGIGDNRHQQMMGGFPRPLQPHHQQPPHLQQQQPHNHQQQLQQLQPRHHQQPQHQSQLQQPQPQHHQQFQPPPFPPQLHPINSAFIGEGNIQSMQPGFGSPHPAFRSSEANMNTQFSYPNPQHGRQQVPQQPPSFSAPPPPPPMPYNMLANNQDRGVPDQNSHGGHWMGDGRGSGIGLGQDPRQHRR